MQAIPLCPITGLPATRLIQLISTKLIIGLWRGALALRTLTRKALAAGDPG